MAESAEGDARYLLSDGLGSVRQAVDETGTVVSYHEYDPYGNPNPQSLTPDPYGFTGEWWADEVGLLHLRARWYLPSDGVFLSRDPVESEHPYLYVQGNVVNYTDPTGFQASNPQDPYDLSWCTDWKYPYKLSCDLITNPFTPEFIALNEMRHIYEILELGAVASGKGVNASFVSDFLEPSTTEVTKRGPFWGNWLRTDTNFKAWHDAQVEVFFRSAVLQAAENCQTSVGPWEVRELPHKRNGFQLERPYPFAEVHEDGALFSLIPIKSFDSEVGVTLGKYWLKGDFYAQNIQKHGNSITADVKIERFIDDVFDFGGDFGDLPIRNLVPQDGFLSYFDPGIGTVPNVWAQELDRNGLASYFKIHIEWEEKFTVTLPN